MYKGLANTVRYALYKKSSAEGDSHLAIYGAVHNGTGNACQRALGGRVGLLLEIVEPRVMESRMVVISAAEISGKVASEGKAVFYGILFGFDKAEIKPESEPQLAEMAKCLQANPQTRVFVIGHTDNKGTLDYNLGLSGRRAEAVVKALSSRSAIDPKRMTPRASARSRPLPPTGRMTDAPRTGVWNWSSNDAVVGGSAGRGAENGRCRRHARSGAPVAGGDRRCVERSVDGRGGQTE